VEDHYINIELKNKSIGKYICEKENKVKELEEENKKLKEQLEILRGKLYERI
jgi:cell shape-determining protein MreC